MTTMLMEQLPGLFDDGGGELTLDEMIVGVWEGLARHRVVNCPTCGGDMRPLYAAGARPVGGRCGDCRSTIT